MKLQSHSGRAGAEDCQGAVANSWLFIQVLQERTQAKRMQQAFLLGYGESEALALASQQPTDMILLDEAGAVQSDRKMELPVLHRVGLLLQTKA